MDQRERNLEHHRHHPEERAGDPPSCDDDTSADLRAENQRLIDAADADFARADAIDDLLDSALSRDSSQFLGAIQQSSGQ